MAQDNNENQIETFDDAGRATEELMEQAQDENHPNDIQPEEADNTPGGEEQELHTMENAVNTAEQAAGLAAQKEQELQGVMSELQTLKQQNVQLQDTLAQMSRQQEETIVDNVMEMPVMDLSDVAFADEATIKKRQEEYANQMAEYVKSGVLKDIEPFVEQAKEGQKQKEREDAVTVLEKIPELAGIRQMLPQLEKIIENNPALSSPDVAMDEKYITAYAIAKGIDAMNAPPPKEPTAEELFKMYENNEEFQKLVEKKRLEQVENGQQVPVLSASSGAVNAALNIKEKPKTFDEASERTRKMFGL